MTPAAPVPDRASGPGGGKLPPLPLPRISAAWLRFFTRYTRRYLARHFDALQLSLASAPAPVGEGPVVIYANHPSWWDPLVFLQLAAHRFPGRPAYGPMAAAELDRYAIFKKLGVFGVRSGVAGARDFTRAATHVLAQPTATLWITAQGRFVDPRVRPVGLAGGVAGLVPLAPGAHFIPLALEYPAWNERLPQALARFGAAEMGADLLAKHGSDRRALTAHFEEHLSHTMDGLAQEAQARSAAAFAEVLSGRRGTSRTYDAWRRLVAWFRGQPYTSGHQSP